MAILLLFNGRVNHDRRVYISSEELEILAKLQKNEIKPCLCELNDLRSVRLMEYISHHLGDNWSISTVVNTVFRNCVKDVKFWKTGKVITATFKCKMKEVQNYGPFK